VKRRAFFRLDCGQKLFFLLSGFYAFAATMQLYSGFSVALPFSLLALVVLL
jgi:hypothetical protein